MSNINSTYSSTSRITGLFSDLDTDALVESMCSNQQSKIDKQQQKLTANEWYTDALGDVIDTVDEFSGTYCSALGSSSMLKSSAYYAYNITSDSKSGAVSLSSSGAQALEGDYSVKVIQLAKNASLSSSGRVSANGTEISANNTATLGSLSFANSLTFDQSGKISFEINGVTFSFTKDTTLQSMINTVNNNEDANVTLKYSRLTDTFTLAADSGGANSSVSVRNLSGNAFGKNSAFMIPETTVRNGCDSIAEINGTTVTRDSNEYTIDGVSFKLNSVTAGTSEEALSFRVGRDYSATVDTITAFVDALNKLLTKLDGLVSAEDRSSDYPPLTDAQKEEMSEEEIEKWEATAKGGVLHNDPTLRKLISDIRSAFFSAAGGTGKAATSFGISTGSYYSSDSGKLVIDTDALKKALETNPDQVVALFTGGDSSSSAADMGIMYQLRSSLSTCKSAAETEVDSTKDRADDIEDGIDKLEKRLDSMAERYYARFAAMETALATLNSQASYISQLFTS